MKKDVNFIFFGILVLLLIAMVGVMLYSDYTYHKVNGQYIEFKKMFEEAQGELNQSRAEVKAKDLELQQKEQALLDIINELNLTKQKETSLSEFYSTVKTEKEGLETKKEELESDLGSCEADKSQMTMEFDSCKMERAYAEREASQYKSLITYYNRSVSDAEAEAAAVVKALNKMNCNNKTSCIACRDNVTAKLEDLQSTIEGML